YRRIAFIAGYETDASDSGDRFSAYQSALREFGLEADPALVAYGLHSLDGGRLAMRRLLDSGVAFSAVLASNDESAIGAMEVLREAGRRIPEDVALIGFDDWLEAAVQTPPLTSVHYPLFEAGYRSFELVRE